MILGGPLRVETQWAEVNAGINYTERVQGACSLTLLQWYASRHAASASIQQWRAAIEGRQMEVNGAPCTDPDARLPPNAVLVHRRPGWAEPAAPSYLDVLWWDAHLVAVHKPSGLQVLPAGPFHERCALTLLRRFHAGHAGQLLGLPAPVHRLGRGTSGVLLCACSDAARSALSRDLVDHGLQNRGRMRKVYRTLVQGLVQADEAEIDVPIGRVEYAGVRGGLYAARPEGGPGAKPSRSRYRVLRRDAAAGGCGGGGTSLVDVEIFTGRPHQIRIHMAAAGHPLVGDPLYGPGGLPYPPGPTGPPAPAAGNGSSGDACEGGGSGGGSTLAVAAAAAAATDGGSEAGGGGRGGAGAAEEPQQLRAAMPGDCGYLLHSMVLEFNHPISGERVTATCPPPPALQL